MKDHNEVAPMSEPTPSIEEIQAAYDRVTSSSESVGIDDDVSTDARLVDAALDELAALRMQVAEQQQKIAELHASHQAALNRCIVDLRHLQDEKATQQYARSEAESDVTMLLARVAEQDAWIIGQQQWHERAEAVLRLLCYPLICTNGDGELRCPYRCAFDVMNGHAASCPVVQARALLVDTHNTTL